MRSVIPKGGKENKSDGVPESRVMGFTKQSVRCARIHVVRQNIADDKKDLDDFDCRLRDIVQHSEALVCTRNWESHQ